MAASAFERGSYDTQGLTFDYARKVFATASLTWDDATLANLGILHVGMEESGASITGIGLLLSDQCPFAIRAAVFEGTDKTHALERRRFSGSVLSQLTEAIAFVNAHNDVEPGWPADAVREGLLNAVLHRDYELNGPIVLSLFADRMEIVSMGPLPGGMGYDDLTNCACDPRNPMLAALFERLGLTHNDGTGLSCVMSSYAGRDEGPQVRLASSSFGLILPRGEHQRARFRGRSAANSKNGESGANDTRTADGGIDTKRYAFVPGRRTITHDPSLALAGTRIVGITPLADILPRPAQLPLAPAMPMSLGPVGAGETLEETTLHLLAQHGVPLTREYIQNTLELTKGQTRSLLNGMVDDGSIVRIGRSRATRYALADGRIIR